MIEYRGELPALCLHQVECVRDDPVLGGGAEGHAPGLEQLQHLDRKANLSL